MYNAILCRYHEIAIKGNNRIMFERCLMDNMHLLFKKEKIDFAVKRVRGRIWVERRDRALFGDEELALAAKVLERTFGLESFSPSIRVEADMEAILAKVKEVAPEVFAPLLAKQQPVSFRVRARRSDKKFPLCSKEIEIAIAAAIAECVDPAKLKVNLDCAEVTFGCELRDEFAILYFKEFQAPGGLPVGCNGTVLALLSGGIDSPVGCYMAMKRGCPVEFLSFHSAPYTPPETTEKIIGIARYINLFQRGGRVFLCNLAEFQKLVRDCCTPKMRTVLYRRAMLRVGELLAEKHHRLALLTGDSVGQVASQTLENMSTIDRAVHCLVLRPLVGMDKNEAIRIAEKIGTMPLSNVQVPDSCTVFAPNQVATHSTVEQAEEEEAKIPNYREVIEAMVQSVEIIMVN